MGNTVYKYCKPHRAKNILNTSCLHFSYPENLNDPQDSLVQVDFMGHPMVFRTKEFAILSLTDSRDVLQMWESYADSHRGVCLGFRTEVHQGSPVFTFQDEKLPGLLGAPKGYLPLYVMGYEQHNLPPYQSPGGDPKRAFAYMVNKRPPWKYERERRVILNPDLLPVLGKLDVDFNPKILEEVIFGAEVSVEDQAEILSILEEKYPDVETFKVSGEASTGIQIIAHR